MTVKEMIAKTPLASYGKTIRSAPRQVVFNRDLILSGLFFAMAAVPLTWDQGLGSTVPNLKGFQDHFHISSGSNPKAIRQFVSLPVIGQAVGAGASFLLNDRIGRLWSMRIYTLIWMIGQFIAVGAAGISSLYASRVISGLGIGALTVTGPMALAEIAPAETRGLMTAWFPVIMGLAHACATLCTYGIYLHVAASPLQYRVSFFVPCVYMFLWMLASWSLCESPRWLFLAGRDEQGKQNLLKLRRLPLDDPRMQKEILDIKESITKLGLVPGTNGNALSMPKLLKSMFCQPSNLRRVQQALISFALPQLSGANSISSYFVPILKIIGVEGGTAHDLFLTSMYTVARFGFATITSFFLIDALGRRKSLFLGITLQMLGDVYVATYLRVRESHSVSDAASDGAIAMIFIHSFGYSAGLLTLPYVFGGELWPNHLRSFGAAMSQSFHWLFSYAMVYALPSLLSETHNWGAFVFFATWCAVALLYVFFVVPEISGLSVEDIERVFSGRWYTAYRTTRQRTTEYIDAESAQKPASTQVDEIKDYIED